MHARNTTSPGIRDEQGACVPLLIECAMYGVLALGYSPAHMALSESPAPELPLTLANEITASLHRAAL
jgi:hypothetical protein